MEPTDIELMLQARTGDLEAFRQLVERYREPLRRFFASLLADAGLSEDCAQETFLRLWLLRDRYEPTGKFSAYLFQIARHHLLNERRRYAAAPTRAVEDEFLELLPSAGSEPEAALLRKESEACVSRAIGELPEHYRAVFVMSHYEGMKYAEIGGRLRIPVGTVKSRMAAAVRLLRAALKKDAQG